MRFYKLLLSVGKAERFGDTKKAVALNTLKGFVTFLKVVLFHDGSPVLTISF